MRIARRLPVQIIKVSILPFLIFASLITFYILYSIHLRHLILENFHKIIGNAFFTVISLSVAFFFQLNITGIFNWYKSNIASKTETKLDDEFLPLFSRISKIILWLIVGVIILSRFGVNINALIATLGVSSLAIALAAQDTIANIISGFLIMIDRPFRIGDTINIPSGEKVKVLDIGVRRSKFLAEDNSIIIVPNNDLSKSKIVNFTYGLERKAR